MISPTATPTDRPANLRSGARFDQLLMLLGLTGFAVSQPLLSIAGEDPTLFTTAGVQGSMVVVFALIVALVPPLALWIGVVLIGQVNRRAADIAFLIVAGLLAGATAVHWVKSAGVEHGWILGAVGALAAGAFPAALARIAPLGMWTRFTAPLPVIAVLLLLVASPVSGLLRSNTGAGALDGQASDLAPVVFVMLDELPLKTLLDLDDQIDPIRFPNLARLAGQSTWYRDYTTLAGGTVQAVPSILTGKVPSNHKPLWTENPDNLFSLLVDTHELSVSETVTQLCGFSTCTIEGSADGSNAEGLGKLLGQMADLWTQRVRLGPVDDIDLGQFQEEVVPLDPELDIYKPSTNFADPERVSARPQRVTDFIEALQPAELPGLYYLHMMLPHQPWTFYPDGQMYSGLWAFLGDDPNDPWVLAQYQQAHMMQVRYADRIVGEIIDQLEAQDMFDESLIVLTADHGVSFEAEVSPQLRKLHESTISDLAYVPLLVKSPGQTQGRIDDTNLMATDVIPLVAQELGIDVTWPVDGYAPGSPEIAARGETKQIYDVGERMIGGIQGVVEFKSSQHRPRAEDRLIGPVGPDAPRFTGLMAYLGVEDLLGASLDDVESASGGDVWVANLDQLQDPDPSSPVPGRVQGRVDDLSHGDLVLISVNGAVVSAAPVKEDHTFATLLPPGSISMDGGNTVKVVQTTP